MEDPKRFNRERFIRLRDLEEALTEIQKKFSDILVFEPFGSKSELQRAFSELVYNHLVQEIDKAVLSCILATESETRLKITSKIN